MFHFYKRPRLYANLKNFLNFLFFREHKNLEPKKVLISDVFGELSDLNKLFQNFITYNSSYATHCNVVQKNTKASPLRHTIDDVPNAFLLSFPVKKIPDLQCYSLPNIQKSRQLKKKFKTSPFFSKPLLVPITIRKLQKNLCLQLRSFSRKRTIFQKKNSFFGPSSRQRQYGTQSCSAPL